jgi:hypothetical protein
MASALRVGMVLAGYNSEELTVTHARCHVVGLGAVGGAVLELDHGQPLLAAQLLDRRSRSLAIAVLHDLEIDALLDECALDLPACIQVGVENGPRAAVQLDLWHCGRV